MKTQELKEKIEECIKIAQHNIAMAENSTDIKMKIMWYDNVNQILNVAENWSFMLKDEFIKELKKQPKN